MTLMNSMELMQWWFCKRPLIFVL